MPDVSVVLATHNRPQRLQRQLAALRAQSLEPERFELIVIDDGSTEETAQVLAAEREQFALSSIAMTTLRNEAPLGPAGARNRAWRVASSAWIAFTDDDCEAPPEWLAHGLEAAASNPGGFVQGPVRPIPAEEASLGPFSHTLRVDRFGPGFETANIFYARELLERLGGFDEAAFSLTGEDSDLAWRAIAAGARGIWAPAALTYHAVENIGPVRSIRRAWRWHETVLAAKRHPGKRAALHRGVFWSPLHAWFLRAVIAALLPGRLWYLRLWLARPYLQRLLRRRSGPLLAPYLILHDLAEVAAMVRGSVRYRTIVL